MKSTREYTVANLHPRKMFREDQKLLDIKRESRERLSKKDVDKTKLRMFDMIYFNPQNNPMKPRPVIKTEKPKLDLKKEFSPTPEKEESSAMPVPRLKLNASGEMVLDESSLVIENEQQKQNRILLANNTVVYDDDFSEKYGIYKRQQRTKEWDQEETVKFYRCLNTVGTDFSMMLNLFPNRTRRDLKLKFKKEEKNNPHLVDKALLKHNVFDLDELQRDLDQEEAEKRKKMEESSKSEVKEHLKRKILKNQEAKLKAEERSRSKIEKILNDGDLAFKIAEENQLKENVDMKKKRKYTRKSKTEVISPTQNNDNGLQMFAGFPGISDSISTDKRRSRKRKNDELETTENVMITPKKTKLEKHPVTITNVSS
jgi:transcription factor TFIIIB component B''